MGPCTLSNMGLRFWAEAIGDLASYRYRNGLVPFSIEGEKFSLYLDVQCNLIKIDLWIWDIKNLGSASEPPPIRFLNDLYKVRCFPGKSKHKGKQHYCQHQASALKRFFCFGEIFCLFIHFRPTVNHMPFAGAT